MLYNAQGREIPTDATAKPIDGRLVTWEPQDRYQEDASRHLDPVKLDNILRQANTGDVQYQARLAREIEEKDFQAAHAISVRRAAALGLHWACKPSAGQEKNAQAVEISAAAEAMLRGVSGVEKAGGIVSSQPDGEPFAGALEEILGALLPGYSCLEMLWRDGGAGIESFVAVPTHFITFWNSMEPRIQTRLNWQGDPLVPNKFVFHRHKSRSGDIARGGLIRPLGWMYCFANLGIKDLLRFVERYGMPFLLARIDESSWAKDRSVIASIVRNFGSDGGAVLSKAVEAELIQAQAGGGDIYFKLLEYFGEWKTKTVLGQLATSGESKGFSQGGAQAAVRQDILESDCAQLARTIRGQVLRPWVMFNHGPAAPVPEFEFCLEAPADLEQRSKIVLNLNQAGLQADPAEASATFGMKLTRSAAPPPSPAPGGVLAMTGERDAQATRIRRRAIALTAQAATDKIAEAALIEVTRNPEIVTKWLKPIQDALDEALAGLPAGDGLEAQAALRAKLEPLLSNLSGLLDDMDSTALEDLLARAMFAADANGRAQAAAAASHQ